MKISKIDIKDFGKFAGSKTIDNIDPRIGLFYGQNEAGKTTMFSLINSLFYGFYPAKSDNHPYSSWENGRIEFTAHISEDSDKITVYRKLLSRPSGSFNIGDRQFKINNDTLPHAEHISKELYEKIYALRVEDLIEIQGDAWEEVEDKLLANYGTDIIKNTRDVLKELKDEYDRLWKNDSRTKTTAKLLEKEKQELKKNIKEIYQREEEIRQADSDLYEINLQIKELNNRKLILRTSLNKAKRLAPVKKIILQIDLLKSKLSNDNSALGLPNNIRDKMSVLRERLHEICGVLNIKKNNIENKEKGKYIFNLQDELLLENKSKVRLFAKKQSNLDSMEKGLSKIMKDIQKTRDRIFHESSNILTDKWNDLIRQNFEKINKSELQILVTEYRRTLRGLEEAKINLNSEKSSNIIKVSLSKTYLATTILGIIGLGIGLLLGNTIIIAIAVVVFIYGAAGIMSYINMKNYQRKTNKNSTMGELRRRIDELQSKLNQDRISLERYLEGIPLSSIIIDRIDDMFLPNLIKIKDLVFELGEYEKEYEDHKKKYNLEKTESIRFLNQFAFEEHVKENEKIYILEDRLEKLDREKLVTEKLDQELKELKDEVVNLEISKGEIEKELRGYRDKLKILGEGDVELGLDKIEEIYKVRSKIDALNEDLSSVSELEIILDEIDNLEEDEKWIFSDYEITKAQAELESVNDKLNVLGENRARLEEKINNLSQGISIDEIESRLEIINEDIEGIKKQRDKLALLYEMIKYADQKFREENQPDVLKNASKYFKIITNGRYTDIYIEESDVGNNIAVKKAGSSIATSITNTFSKGTLNQLFLSLRLSLIDHLDKNASKLPVCFDELLVNWDENRLESSLKLIDEISKNRQIFMFTCHDWLAQKIERYFKVNRIKL